MTPIRREIRITGHQIQSQSAVPDFAALVDLYRQGRLDQAIAGARAHLAQFSHSVFCWKLLGVAYQRIGDVRAALAAKRTAVSLAPEDAESVANLYNSYEAAGLFDSALRVGRQMVTLAPNSPFMHHGLAGILLRRGQLHRASQAYQAAIVADPAFTEAYLHCGNLRFGWEQLDSAAGMFRRALSLQPDLADAANNLGNVLLAQRKPDLAEACYRRALRSNPGSASIHFNLGQIVHRAGRLPEARDCLQKGLALSPDLVNAYFVFGHVCCALGDDRTAARSFRHLRSIDPLDKGPLGAVYGALLSFLQGDLSAARSLLAEAAPLGRSATLSIARDRDISTAQAYWVLLDRLLAEPARQEPPTDPGDSLPTLYVVGDSHCLAAHRQVIWYRGAYRQCQSEWIAGCKQWDLGNDVGNPQKYRCEAVFAKIPRQSHILTLVGEIDCRSDEGILRAWRARPGTELAEMVETTVDHFIGYVAALADRHGHNLIIGGVPCPLPETAGADNQVALIRQFNARLRQQAEAAGMDFLDLHSLTDRGDGFASGDWHIDRFHLVSAALGELFRRKANQPDATPR